jgi:DNA-binding response OmpR family regulator
MKRIHKSVLIIDSSSQVQDMLFFSTLSHGLSPYICPNSVNPIAQARRLGVDGVILSIDSVNSEYMDIIKAFMHHYDLQNTPLLVITSCYSDHEVKVLKDTGCKNILVKPFNVEKISRFFEENNLTYNAA